MLDDTHCELVAVGRYLQIADIGDGSYAFSCSEKEFDSIWFRYFDLGRDYSAEELLRIAVNSRMDGIVYSGGTNDKVVSLINKAADEGIGGKRSRCDSGYCGTA